MQKVIILYNQILSTAPDELDVLAQRDLVKAACENLGFVVECRAVGDNLMKDIGPVGDPGTFLIFNLVESTWGKGELIYFVPAVLNALQMPYTGVPLDALFLTTNKVLAKKMLRLHALPTADFYAMDELHLLHPQKTYIVKPIWEEASVGITADSVFTLQDKNKLKEISGLSSSHYFVEEFIEGREFNISILAHKEGAEVLPPAEMIFSSYYDDKPTVIGYKAKWDEESDEYHQTNRAFGMLENNPDLKNTLIDVCQRCWTSFNLHGYARIDFRVDANNQPYILEINGNPCIAPDSGFIAALQEAGYSNEIMIERILMDLN